MVKHTILAILLSILAIFYIRQVAIVFHYYQWVYQYFVTHFAYILPRGGYSMLISKMVILFLLPLVITLLCLSIYKVIIRKRCYYFGSYLWCSWLVLVALLAAK